MRSKTLAVVLLLILLAQLGPARVSMVQAQSPLCGTFVMMTNEYGYSFQALITSGEIYDIFRSFDDGIEGASYCFYNVSIYSSSDESEDCYRYTDAGQCVPYSLGNWSRVERTDYPPSPTETPPAEINFWADSESIAQGQCTTVHWDVEYVLAVEFDGEGLPGHDRRKVCPNVTTNYNLRIIKNDGDEWRTVTVNVVIPALPPTPVPPMDTPTPLPSPTPLPTNTPMPPLPPIVFVPGYYACSDVSTALQTGQIAQQVFSKIVGKTDIELYKTSMWAEAVTIYKPLLRHLRNQGYQLNGNLFIACYDWSGTLEEAALQLRDKVDEAYRATGLPVTIMTHSTGGIVARYAIQHDLMPIGFNSNNQPISVPIKDLIMIAPPNNGAARPYYTWEGGDISQEFEVAPLPAIALLAKCHVMHPFNKFISQGRAKPIPNPHYKQDLLDYQQKILNCSRHDSNIVSLTVDKTTPILAWFMPPWGFLKQPNGTLLPYPNAPISRLNTPEQIQKLFNGISGNVHVLMGDAPNSTLKTIAVNPTTQKPLWQNGEPLDSEFNIVDASFANRLSISLKTQTKSNGDETILVESASLPHATEIAPNRYYPHIYKSNVISDVGHTEGMVKGTTQLNDISKILGIAPVSSSLLDTNNNMSVFVASPVNLLVTNPQGQQFGIDANGTFINTMPDAIYQDMGDPLGPKFIYLVAPTSGNYSFQVTGVADGEYGFYVYSSNADEPVVSDHSSIKLGEIKNYTAPHVAPVVPTPPAPAQPSTATTTKSFFYSVPIDPIANDNVGAYGQASFGDFMVDNIPFKNVSATFGTQGSFLKDRPTVGTLKINPPIASASKVFVLINSGNTFSQFSGQQIGTIDLRFSDGSVQTTQLIAGQNIREWAFQTPGTIGTVSSPDVREVKRVTKAQGGDAVLDMLTIAVPAKNANLVEITFNDTSQSTVNSLDPGFSVAGVTVQSQQTVSVQPSANANTFQIQATKAWQDTGIQLKAGSKILIKAKGTWTHNNTLAWYGADGRADTFDNKVYVPQAKVGTLVGRIGQGKPFALGSNIQLTSNAVGNLFLTINEWPVELDPHGLDDNSGFLEVEITLSGQPSTAPNPASNAKPVIEWINIPSGNFIMGSSDNDLNATLTECNETEGAATGQSCQLGWFGSEKPQRTLNLGNYSISKYEITNVEYNACVTSGVCPKIGQIPTSEIPYNPIFFADKNPAVGVSQVSVTTFCQWVGGRLPSEEEWEKAARGTDGRRYPWGNSFDSSKANLSSAGPVAVGSYPSGASPYSVMDMTGNVFEWTATQISGNYVVRGGGWSKYYFRGRVTDRGTQLAANFVNYDIGFRCVK